jgi:hypothetical protein
VAHICAIKRGPIARNPKPDFWKVSISSEKLGEEGNELEFSVNMQL